MRRSVSGGRKPADDDELDTGTRQCGEEPTEIGHAPVAGGREWRTASAKRVIGTQSSFHAFRPVVQTSGFSAQERPIDVRLICVDRGTRVE